MKTLLLAFLLFSASTSAALKPVALTDSAEPWLLRGERMQVQFLPDTLERLKISFGAEKRRSTVTFDLDGSTLQFAAPFGNFDGAIGGGLGFEEAVVLNVGARSIEIEAARLDPLLGPTVGFDLVDEDGQVWLELRHVHDKLDLQADHIRFMNMDVRVGLALADALGEPRLRSQQLGTGLIEAQVIQRGFRSDEPERCVTPVWPSPSNPGDVGLSDLSGFQYMRGRNVDGPGGTNGEMVVAPDAELRNVGDKDIPWYTKFFDPRPPYGNDQHPFLVWSLYRLDATGQLKQVARSAVKHAFLTINAGCDCTNFNVLGLNCSDVYAAGNNDTPIFGTCSGAANCDLAPRSEIDPRTGVWGRCGSIYDQNCDGNSADTQAYDTFTHRMIVRETEVDPALNPGARYFFDGWYVVRDDGNIFNSMGFREITPLWLPDAQQWLFNNQVSAFSNGTVLERWRDLPPEPLSKGLQTRESVEGRVQIAVRVKQQGKSFVYQYVVLNLDWMRSSFSGTNPNLRLVSSVGLNEFEFPGAADSVSFYDGDDSLPDWTSSIGAVTRLTAPAGQSQKWGTAYSVTLISDSPPESGTLRVRAASSPTTLLEFQLPVPSSDQIFKNGFD